MHSRMTHADLSTVFCQPLAAAWPEALKISLVQDNLNTHNASSFYENLPADEAFALAQRFEFVYTPKSASWLNMVEIELSVVSRACLDRRIPDVLKLTHEVLAFVQQRHDQQLKINWQFSLQTARHKLASDFHNAMARWADQSKLDWKTVLYHHEQACGPRLRSRISIVRSTPATI